MSLADLAELVVVSIIGGTLACIPWQRRRKPDPPATRTCTGYEVKDSYGRPTQSHDCEALASLCCNDGRCVFHCRSHCKCDPTASA